MRGTWRAASTAILLIGLLGGCGAAKAGRPLSLPRSPDLLTRSGGSHFVVLVMENRELGDVIGDRSWPYVNALAARYALARDYHAITHPSLPNYIALLAGDPLGVTSDCTDCHVRGPDLTAQLDRARVSWRAYMEGLPRACDTTGGSGSYVKKHNPFAYFAGAAGPCRSVVPLSALADDLRTGRLPRFAWISPNLCDDGHDCANATADRFLAHLVPYLLAELGPRGVLALTWDEGTTDAACCGRAHGGRVPLILAGPGVRAHTSLATPADHYSLLGLIEDVFGQSRLRGAGCSCTPSLSEAFAVAPRRIG